MSNRTDVDRLIAKCSSWHDFSREMEALTKKSGKKEANKPKGDAFERLTQLYLLTKPEYQTLFKNIWICSSDLPRRIRNKLKNLPSTDEGIDLVAETRNGEFWSIQSKYRSDNAKPLTYKELSTFTNLTFVTCKGEFSQALVVHTSNKPVKKRKLLGNTSEIGLQRWLEMTPEDWELIRKQLSNQSVRPSRRRIRPHQKKAIKAAVKHFVKDKQSRGKLIMPCGTGKSLTAFWIAEELKAKTVLLVVPSLALIKQGVEDWTQEIVARKETPLPKWLCVCSDESTGAISKDEFVSETYDLGLPVTTDPKEIQQFLAKRSRKRRIVFVTYQSSPLFAKAARKAGVKFDLAILDEAHKTAGNKSKAFATLLFDKNLPIKNRMFMTATERTIHGRGRHDEVVSMDEAEVYGDCFYELSFKEAIDSKPPIISDYKVITFCVSEDEIKSVIKDRRFITDHKHKFDAKDSRELAAAISLRKACKKYRLKHAVSFHRSRASAEEFSELHTTINDFTILRPKIECFYISSKNTAGERAELLKNFSESSKSLITNARCLTEGVDVPAIDCVLFADPKHSKVDIVQAAGRALRTYAGKNFGYLMLPIVVPNGERFDDFAESTEFRHISRVIAALSIQDERIAEEFRVVDRVKKKGGGIIDFEGNVPVGLKMNFREFADAISIQVWERVAKLNWRPIEEAREYARSLNINTVAQWQTFTKSGDLPKDIPVSPDRTYGDKDWIDWGDWLGTGAIASHLRKFRPFKEAREFARSLKLKSVPEWRKFTKSGKLPNDIPTNPDQTHKDKGWIDWGDWLGTGTAATRDRKFRSFQSARKFVRSLKLKGTNFFLFAKSGDRPDDIPGDPSSTYKGKGWVSWPDWLGYNRKHLPFKQAREFARNLNLKTTTEWKKFTKSGKLPEDIPANPDVAYKGKGWAGMGDWLGTGTIAYHLRKYRPFKEARKFARSLNLKGQKEWLAFAKSGAKSGKLPKDIPANLRSIYKDKGWISDGDWLGTGRTANQNRKFLPFKEARKFARSLISQSVD